MTDKMTAQRVEKAVAIARDKGQRPDFCGADLSSLNLSYMDLHDADFRDADLRDAKLHGVNLSGSDMTGARMSRADLRRADMSEAKLCYVNLRGAYLYRADMRAANLRGASLFQADLYRADLRNADLFAANLSCADLAYTVLTGANVAGLFLDGLPSGHLAFIPTPKGWQLSIGCWSGTTSELREMIAKDEGWPGAEEEEIPVRRPMLEAAADMCDSYAAAYSYAVAEVKTAADRGEGKPMTTPSQTIPGVTDEDRRLSHEWAENVRRRPGAYLPEEQATARVILNAVPTPPRPTLADMTEEERAACQWMQADTKLWGRVVIVLHNAGGGRAVTLNREGHMAYEDHGTITPRPDLPRLAWPGDTPAPALPDGWRLADHQRHGRVIVTNPTPNRNGYVYVVTPDAGNFTGYDWLFCDPDELTYIDQEADQ